jgi:hypothetical protein
LDPRLVIREDDRFIYEERRYRAIGAAVGNLLCVVFAERDDVIRIISARKATQHERQEYQIHS